ncbi:MAG TPA: squalene/phytoene synthase family protein, partial [Phycisphaerae bacterium]|nr:squalene/phytoene synthase family protein [Phycisphaerae bacterium]
HVLTVYCELPHEVREPIRICVHEMVAGMRAIAPVETRDGISFFCRDLSDLDRYCHIVAGTVGVMSTALFEWKLAGSGFEASPEWREKGRRLGLGLQMTNIIKDCRVDAERRVSFIPSAYVTLNEGRFELTGPGRREIFTRAVEHLDAGLEYTLTIPRENTGIRRFLLGSLLPAIATLQVAASGTEHHPKIDRDKMMHIIELIAAEQVTDEAIRTWYAEHRASVLDLV